MPSNRPRMYEICPPCDTLSHVICPRACATLRGSGIGGMTLRCASFFFAEPGNAGARRFLHGLVIAHLHVLARRRPGGEFVGVPAHAAVVGIVAHAVLLAPAVAQPQRRFGADALVDERIDHAVHVPQGPGDGVALRLRLARQRVVVEVRQGAVDHAPVPLQGGQYSVCRRHDVLLRIRGYTPPACGRSTRMTCTDSNEIRQ